ncbi:hypothetical protein ACJMK2_005108 [Sinanodonta woodiana]|uniref:Nicotinamide-nucleotide adenylyltransferase n=1 Tax=Sinanodonta woodiana TaxID=1069815 RepID=A0ABD3VP52_SINWO
MSSVTKVVLLACGSFNPITNMHLRMFELARDALNRTGRYNVIAGIISPVCDAYGKKELVSTKHRCAMVNLALKTAKWIRLDTWESEQPAWTETARVLSHFRVELENQMNTNITETPNKKRRKNRKIDEEIDRGPCPNRHDIDQVSLKLLCGGDLLESFGTPGLWKDEDIEDIVRNYGLVCITRGGSDPKKFIYESDVLSKYQENIFIVTEWITNEISATKIRRAIRRGESVKYLLQDSVIDYIRENQLFGIPDNKYLDYTLPSPDQPNIMPMDCLEDVPNDSLSIDLEIDMNDSCKKNKQIENLTRTCNSPRCTSNPRSSPGPKTCQNLEITPSLSPTHFSFDETSNPASPGKYLGNLDMVGPSSTRKAADNSTSNSPKRLLDGEEDETYNVGSPKHVPCMADLGSIVRRVRNVRVGSTKETRVFAFTTETCV